MTGRETRRRWAPVACVLLYTVLLVLTRPLVLAAMVQPETDHGFAYELGKGLARR